MTNTDRTTGPLAGLINLVAIVLRHGPITWLYTTREELLQMWSTPEPTREKLTRETGADPHKIRAASHRLAEAAAEYFGQFQIPTEQPEMKKPTPRMGTKDATGGDTWPRKTNPAAPPKRAIQDPNPAAPPKKPRADRPAAAPPKRASGAVAQANQLNGGKMPSTILDTKKNPPDDAPKTKAPTIPKPKNPQPPRGLALQSPLASDPTDFMPPIGAKPRKAPSKPPTKTKNRKT